ncbi:uncharacterized protein LOC144127784 [Amblyomma americanum]
MVSEVTSSRAKKKMTELPPPEPLRVGANVADNWTRFKQRVELYFIATESTEPGRQRSNAQKAAILLHLAGQEAIDVYNTFDLTAEDKDYDKLVQAFEAYCLPQSNETFERYVFRNRTQAEGEPFEQLYRDLQLKSKTCNFDNLRESMLRDQIVYGTSSKTLREKLLAKKDLTLTTAVEWAKAEEITAAQSKVWSEDKSVDAANLLPRGLFEALGTKQQPEPARAVLRSYGGNEIVHMGKVCLPVRIGADTRLVEFFVVKKGRQAILGLQACEQFGLVNRIRAVKKDEALSECVRRQYPKLFTGIGKLKREYSMTLQDGARPVAEPARRVPHAIRSRLKEELDRLEAAGIIAKVREPSDWVSPLVIARKKNGQLRVCMDPKK